ncbi:MAG: aquaporin [Sphaerimonospora mesophila]
MATKKAAPKKKPTSAKKSVAAKPVSASKVTTKKTTSAPAPMLKPGALIAELIGTFVLAAVVINLASNSNFGTIGIALVLAILVVVFGAVSGAHLNPAITIAQYVNKKIDGVKASAYIGSQVLGAVLALVIMTGIMQANWDYNGAVRAAVENAGVSSATIDQAGGLEKWAETYGGVESVASQLGIENKAPKTFTVNKLVEGKEWVAFLAEILGAIVFGLGVGYAVFGRSKSRIEAGLAVGLGLLAGAVIGGATVILNPAVAAAVGGFHWANPFGADAGLFWWPVLVYIFGTTIGMVAGVTAYRFILRDAETE